MILDDFFKKGDALIIVDVQADFCPGGALPIEAGDRVVPVINDWLQIVGKKQVPVFASRDWHPLDHVSFQTEGGKWPVHCVQDTPGAAFHKDLKLPSSTVVVTKGVRFDHDQNSAFDETGLGVHLKRKGIKRVLVAGLALDVCVLATALDARNEGFDVVLISNAVQSVDAAAGARAVLKMRNAGVVVLANESDQDDPTQLPDEVDVCVKAPEWAEHQRFSDDDMGCDDGRAG